MYIGQPSNVHLDVNTDVITCLCRRQRLFIPHKTKVPKRIDIKDNNRIISDDYVVPSAFCHKI